MDSTDPTRNRVLTVGNDYRFLNSTTIEMLANQTGYDRVRIQRQTDSELVVSFRDGSVLTASDLTNAELQAIHIAEEGRDQTVDLAAEYAEAARLDAEAADKSRQEAHDIADSLNGTQPGFVLWD